MAKACFSGLMIRCLLAIGKTTSCTDMEHLSGVMAGSTWETSSKIRKVGMELTFRQTATLIWANGKMGSNMVLVIISSIRLTQKIR